MNNWKIIPTIVFATALIFSAGIFTGGVLGKKTLPSCVAAICKPSAPKPAPPPVTPPVATNPPAASSKPPAILNKDFLQRLDNDLHLTKDQHDAVQKIITDGQNLIRKTIQDARLEIRDVLTPEQQDQFDEIMKRPFRKPIFTTNAPPGTASAPTNPPASAPEH